MKIDPEIFNAVGNRLTDVTDTGFYKRTNPHIFSGYYGLSLASSKLAFILFGFILRTKFYGDKAKEKEIDEDRRIYTDITITIDDILKEWDHPKYSKGQDTSSNISNMNKRIKEMDDNNIFYRWKYKKIYMFVMERDCRTWKNYNSKGCCIPKTLRKILVVGNDMISCMVKNTRNMYNEVNKSDIEKSFGYFINCLIDKLHPLVMTEIAKWDGKQDISEYIASLLGVLQNMEEYKGLTFADDIFDKMPASLSIKMQEEIRKGLSIKDKHEKNKVISDAEKDIIPANPNIVKSRHCRKAVSHPPKEGATIQAYDYTGSIDPLKDARQFMDFYRSVLQSTLPNLKVQFNNYAADSVFATQILDLLQERQRLNRVFLNAWIRYFCDYKLKGEKALKSKYTSLRVFGETFEEYNCRHVEAL